MRCPHCQHENPSGAKFCLECGTRFVLTCTKCGTELPAGAKFCLECGPAVGAQPTVEGASHRPFPTPPSMSPKRFLLQKARSKASPSKSRCCSLT
ncbi:MAG TPA: zinc-ribbon domain-containing protein [Candidatus Binatia bacterium]|nr:zinc-ribbon domain-containing protein [Candidatus Binatia bacterium]